MPSSPSETVDDKPNAYVIVERLENWRIDQHNNFKLFGIPGRLEKTAAEIKSGDILIVYVSSGISAFSDIRRVTSDKLEKLRFGGDYDTAFPLCVRTESVFVLDRRFWVPIKGMVEDLSFTKGKKDWRQVMRYSLRKISNADADLIVSSMKGAKIDAA